MFFRTIQRASTTSKSTPSKSHISILEHVVVKIVIKTNRPLNLAFVFCKDDSVSISLGQPHSFTGTHKHQTGLSLANCHSVKFIRSTFDN